MQSNHPESDGLPGGAKGGQHHAQPPLRVTGLLLAAGAATRFGGGKLLAKLADGTAVGHRACANLVAALGDVIAVVRPGDDALAAMLASAGARVSVCGAAQEGMGASLAHGARSATDENADAIVIALADMPWLSPDTLRQVHQALAKGLPLVVPRFRGQRGHPVGFGRAHFAALARLGDDAGARDVIAGAPAIHWIEVDDPGVLQDVDTPADLAPRAS